MQTLHLPQAPDLPLAFASSHNGHNFPGDMRPAAPPEALATSWDVVVDELSGHAPGCGGTPLEA
jgi:N-formylglutamate amidohydrolase